MKDKLKVIKIGGNIIDHNEKMDEFLRLFAQLTGAKVLVHGGGKKATQMSKKLGIIPKMHEGRRVTSDEALDVVTMVYAGLINKNTVASLQKHQCNAIGLSGADGNMIKATKRPAQPYDYGWAGDIVSVNGLLLKQLVEIGLCPVACAITHDKSGQLLNTNADTIASEIAISLSVYYEVELVYVFEKKGVLKDINDENSVIEKITPDIFQVLKQQEIIHTGMLPKLTNCFHAIEKGVKKVSIGHQEILTDASISYTKLIAK